ncbi:MAG TPA: sigma-70 family RNA polymerase sigma factor [Actinomycetota bacterium]|nr:sigma-70 family RNA polymerase sigma factor [Actinomycetota bacterium]
MTKRLDASRNARSAVAMTKAATRGGASFETFYADEYQKVFACAFAWARDPEIAFDATQEAFSRALARWHRLRSNAWATGWVITTALNHCRRQRWLAARERTQREDHPSVTPTDGSRVDLLRALGELPPRQRRAAILFYVGDYPAVAVAETMGISEGAVKAHLARARERLRASLGDAYVMTADDRGE